MREVVGRALSLNTRPLHTFYTPMYVRPGASAAASLDSSPHNPQSPAAALIAHVCESTHSSPCEHQHDMFRCMARGCRLASVGPIPMGCSDNKESDAARVVGHHRIGQIAAHTRRLNIEAGAILELKDEGNAVAHDCTDFTRSLACALDRDLQ